MNLQGRNLSARMQGEDVTLLQRELAKLSYQIAADEQQRTFFGPTTQQAVLSFQKAYRRSETRMVDARTAVALASEDMVHKLNTLQEEGHSHDDATS